jgi:O-antigen/teichoic acid export membrane protein
METQPKAPRGLLKKGQNKIKNFLKQNDRWLKKGGAAFVDQALFAGSNFIVNWLILLWMPKEEAGAVIVAFTWFLLLQTFYDALTVSPMSYYGAGKYSKEFKRYLAYIFYGHMVLAALVTVCLGVGAYLTSASARFYLSTGLAQTALGGVLPTLPGTSGVLLGAALAGAALAAPFLLARGLIRQPFYILSIPAWSAVGGGLYLVANILTTFLLYITDNLTPFTAILGMGIAALLTTILQVAVLKPEFRKPNTESIVNTRDLIIDHWRQGRWSLSARGLSWVSTNSGYLLLPLVVGFGGSAALRAAMNLIMPISQTNAAMLSLLTPAFVRAFNKEGTTGLKRRVWKVTQVIFLVTFIYFIGTTLFGQWLIHLLYDGKYDQDITLLFIIGIGLIPVITTISRILDAALVALGRIKNSFQSKIIPTIATVVFDIVFVAAFGTIGIVLESVITSTMTLVNVYWYYARFTKHKESSAAPETSPSAVSVEVKIG